MSNIERVDDVAAMLAESIERYTAQNYSFERRRSLLSDSPAFSGCSWADYASFGWLSLRLPEQQGGIGADACITATLMEVVGARLLMEPLLASVIVSTGLVLASRSISQRETLLPQLAEGTLKLAFAHQESLTGCIEPTVNCEVRDGQLFGSKLAVLHGDIADRLIVSARNARTGAIALYLVGSDDVRLRRERFALVDGRGAANLYFEGSAVEPLAIEEGGPSEIAIADALDEAAVALCSEAYGVIRALNTQTLQYLKLRKQFGKPIGSNQALQHRMVEMLMLQHEVRALNTGAQRALAERRPGRARQISGARVYIADAARKIANEAVQMHGGIGVTDELDVSHYYRRLMTVRTLFGSRDEHFDRFLQAEAQ